MAGIRFFLISYGIEGNASPFDLPHNLGGSTALVMWIVLNFQFMIALSDLHVLH